MEKQLAPLSWQRVWIFLYHTGAHGRMRTCRAASCHSVPPAQHLVIKASIPASLMEGEREERTAPGAVWLHLCSIGVWLFCSLIIKPPESAACLLPPPWIFLCSPRAGRQVHLCHTLAISSGEAQRAGDGSNVTRTGAVRCSPLIQAPQQKDEPWPTHVRQNCWAPRRASCSHWM